MPKKKKTVKKRRGSKILVAEEVSSLEHDSAVHMQGEPEPSEMGRGATFKGGKRTAETSAENDDDDKEELVFEHAYADDSEEEEIIVDSSTQPTEDDVEELAQTMRAWRPGVDKLEDGEQLEFDNKSYCMFHRMRMEWPCLSFDFVRDGLGDNRASFPMTSYAVSGTQADEGHQNKLLIMKLSHLHSTQKDSDSESDDDDDEDILEEDAILEHREIEHTGGVNRVRCQPQSSNIVASWSDSGAVHVWDVRHHLEILDGPLPLGTPVPRSKMAPLQTFDGHASEGFALDWSYVHEGRLATGDCEEGAIHIWEPREDGWDVGGMKGIGHEGSVEDLQWSPSEASVVASCSADGSVVIWDARAGMEMRTGARIIRAHESDVNVISWNRLVAYLIVSGGDDGTFRIWDLRTLKSSGEAPEAAAMFKHHNAPITSVEWCPTDRSVIAVTGADDQTTIWDMSVERDAEEEALAASAGVADIPSQLLFVHQGQEDVKEVHWHPQLTNVLGTTASDGYNTFKPANL